MVSLAVLRMNLANAGEAAGGERVFSFFILPREYNGGGWIRPMPPYDP